MINNNRQAGRRRGRGGQRQGGNPNAGNGNRIDNRARGNASQLLEKYKALAADAQRQGDRVNAEYYLQFADHYFRVLAESRSRFDEQNPNQRRGREDSFDDDEDGFDEDGNDAPAPVVADAEPRRPQGRDDRDDRGNRANGANGNSYAANDGAPAEAPGIDREQPRRPRLRREQKPVAAPATESFDAALLPPSLSVSADNEPDAPKPRRGRPPRSRDAEAAE